MYGIHVLCVILGSASDETQLLQSRPLRPLPAETRCAHFLNYSVPSTPKPISRIYWLHFPKAGWSILTTLWQFACGQRVPIDLSKSVFKSKQDEGYRNPFGFLRKHYPRHQYCDDGVLAFKLDSGHTPVTAQQIITQQWNVVSMFRKPSQRLISSFNYHHLDGIDHLMFADGFNMSDYQDLIQTCGPESDHNTPGCFARYDGIAGCYARMLTGGRCGEKLGFDGGKSRLEDALRVVDMMPFVGITEEWALSICLFHRMFGGKVTAAQLEDIHAGPEHQQSYDESLLEGFVDEVDEAIYAAAKQKFQQLLQKHVSDRSLCGDILTPKPATACSCADAARECGYSAELDLDCGVCEVPYKWRKWWENLDPEHARLECDQSRGRCLLDGQPIG